MADKSSLPIAISLLVLILGQAPFLQAAEKDIPQGYTPERYERIWKKSPFTVASVLVPVAEDTSNFTDTLSLVGLVIDDGKPIVTIIANDSQETSLLEGDKPNSAGLQIVSFVNDLDPAKIEVVLKKGDATGTLHVVVNETAPPPTQPTNVNATGQPRRLIMPNANGVIPNPVQPRVIPRTGAPTLQTPVTAPVIRRRTLQVPGPTTKQGSRSNNRSGVIPPP